MSKPSLSKYAVAMGPGVVKNDYHFNLMGPIGEPEDYTDLLNTLRRANEEDEVYIHINSPGGYVTTAVQIVNSIKNSKASVIGIIESEAASCATIIFLACDGWIVEDDTISMFHQYSGGGWNEGHKLKAQVAAMDSWITELNKKYYKHFLSESEISEMLEGKDFWFTAEEMRARLEHLIAEKRKELELKEVQKQKETVEQARLIINSLEKKEPQANDKGNN